MRIDRTCGTVKTSCRSTLRKCSVSGTRPTMAACGRDARHRYSSRPTTTPVITPSSTPASRVITIVAKCAEKSALERSEEHTSELQSLMRNSYAVFCLQNKIQKHNTNSIDQ